MGIKANLELDDKEYFVEIEKRVKIVGTVFVVTLFDDELITQVGVKTIDVQQDGERSFRIDFLKAPTIKYIDVGMSLMEEIEYLIDEGLL